MQQFILALALALVSGLALAQAGGAPPVGAAADGPPGAGKPPSLERMQDDLGLTDEQVKKMREIRDQGGSRAQMQAVLTPEQRAKVAAQRKEHGGNREERKARMQEQLGLSDEQKAQLAELRKKGGTREEMRAVLTPAQQAKLDALQKQHPRPKPVQTPAPGPAPNPAE